MFHTKKWSLQLTDMTEMLPNQSIVFIEQYIYISRQNLHFQVILVKLYLEGTDKQTA